ncbi:MAG: CBS domain-containing protein, partial [Gammaproteobacteria bacterium]|nr:CBS domain-containing protein [Gammaproteobacteria bacterium]
MTDPHPDEILHSFELALPIALISTPRHQLKTCTPDDRIEDVIAETREEDYDYVPVILGASQDEVIGVLRTKPHRVGSVREEFDPLSEPLLIGGDASILEFVRVAGSQPYRLVLAGARICGLVTLSDMQKLPARAALFGLMTDLELVLQETISRRFEPPKWKRQLNEARLDALRGNINRATSGGVLIHDEILYTELCDKLDIVRKMPDVRLTLKEQKR